MSKWVVTIVVASVFYLFSPSALYLIALLWGAAMARQSVCRNLFLALLIAGLLIMHCFVPPRMQPFIMRLALIGFICGGILIGIGFARKFFSADMQEYLREQAEEQARFKRLLLDSLGIAWGVFPGQSAEIFFSRSDDRFAGAVAERYRRVGWKAIVYHIPLPDAIHGDNVVVITAPEDNHELQYSLVMFDFWID
jgi:hypothetical protein